MSPSAVDDDVARVRVGVEEVDRGDAVVAEARVGLSVREDAPNPHAARGEQDGSAAVDGDLAPGRERGRLGARVDADPVAGPGRVRRAGRREPHDRAAEAAGDAADDDRAVGVRHHVAGAALDRQGGGAARTERRVDRAARPQPHDRYVEGVVGVRVRVGSLHEPFAGEQDLAVGLHGDRAGLVAQAAVDRHEAVAVEQRVGRAVEPQADHRHVAGVLGAWQRPSCQEDLAAGRDRHLLEHHAVGGDVDGAVHAERRVERAVGQVSQQPGGRRAVRVVGAGVQQHEDAPVRLDREVVRRRGRAGPEHASVAAEAGIDGADRRAGPRRSGREQEQGGGERQPEPRGGHGHAVWIARATPRQQLARRPSTSTFGRGFPSRETRA